MADLDELVGGMDSSMNTSKAVVLSDLVTVFKDLWRNERYAPELLPEKMYIVDCLLEQINQKEEEGSLQQPADGAVDHDQCTVNKLECSRIRYWIANYLRCRLDKIENFCVYLQNLPQNEQNIRLSHPEMEFLYGLVEKTEQHLKSSIGPHLPAGVNVLDERSGWYRNPTKPKMDAFIIVKPKDELINVRLDDRIMPGRVEHEDLQAGGQYLLRYNSIRDYIFTVESDDEKGAKAILM